MLIECTLTPRNDGKPQVVFLDNVGYTFVANKRGFAVALVTREDHVESLLHERMGGAYAPHGDFAQKKRAREMQEVAIASLQDALSEASDRLEQLRAEEDVAHERALADESAYVDAAAEEEARKAEEEDARAEARRRVSEQKAEAERLTKIRKIMRNNPDMSEDDAARELDKPTVAPTPVAKASAPTKPSTPAKSTKGTAAKA